MVHFTRHQIYQHWWDNSSMLLNGVLKKDVFSIDKMVNSVTHGTSFLLDSSLCVLYSLLKWKRDCYEKLLLKLPYHVAAVVNHITSFANCRIALSLNVSFCNKIFRIIRKLKSFQHVNERLIYVNVIYWFLLCV